MDNTKNDNYFIDKIKRDISFVVDHMKDVDLNIVYETLKQDIPELFERFK